MDQQKIICQTCLKSKSTLSCGICSADLCKTCAQFLDAEFEMMKVIPSELSHQVYCHQCYDSQVIPQLEHQQELIERAKNVQVYFKDQGKETRLFKRTELPIQVVDCKDYDECLLRLAYFAVERGFNTLIDVDVVSKKVRQDTYQLTLWSGTGVPLTRAHRE